MPLAGKLLWFYPGNPV